MAKNSDNRKWPDSDAACKEVRIFNMRIYSVISQMPPIDIGGFRIYLDGLHRDVSGGGLVVVEHEHPSYEISWMEQGKMSTVCDEEKVETDAADGMLLVISPLILHHRAFEDGLNVNTSMVWRIDALEETARKRLDHLPELIRAGKYQMPKTPWMNTCFAEIERQLELNRPLSKQIISNLLHGWITVFFQEHFSELFMDGWENFLETSSLQSDRVAAVKMLIENRMNRTFLLSHLAESFSLSSRQLNRIFQAETGMSIKKYYDRQRIIRAEYLLLNTSAPISEIACSIGFTKPRLFNAFFHRYHNLPPLEFRKRHMS